MGRWSTLPKPRALPDEHGVVHEVCYLDAVYWRPECMIVPSFKPKGWKHMQNLAVTCLVCLAGVPERWFAP